LSYLRSRYPRAQFFAAPDWKSSLGLTYPAWVFTNGEGQARIGYVAFQISRQSGADGGAAMIHGYGPWPAQPPDFTKLSAVLRKCAGNPTLGLGPVDIEVSRPKVTRPYIRCVPRRLFGVRPSVTFSVSGDIECGDTAVLSRLFSSWSRDLGLTRMGALACATPLSVGGA